MTRTPSPQPELGYGFQGYLHAWAQSLVKHDFPLLWSNTIFRCSSIGQHNIAGFCCTLQASQMQVGIHAG